MTTAKYKISLLFIFVSLTGFTQETSTDLKSPFIIKTNLNLYISGEAYISCEKFLKRNRIEAGIGIIYPFRPWINFVQSQMYTLGEETVSYYHGTGFTIRTQYKIKLRKGKPNSHLYFTPLIMYKHVWKNKVWVYYPDGEHNRYGYAYEHLESDKKNVYALELLLNHEKLINNAFLIDVYFGVGWRIFMLYDRNVYDGKPHGLGHPYKLRDEEESLISFHLGLNIGFNVNK